MTLSTAFRLFLQYSRLQSLDKWNTFFIPDDVPNSQIIKQVNVFYYVISNDKRINNIENKRINQDGNLYKRRTSYPELSFIYNR